MADPVNTATATAPTQAPASPAAPQAVPAAAPPQQPPPAPSLLNPEPPKAAAPKEAPKADIKLVAPKDSLLQQAHVDKIAAFARDRGLSQEQASAAMELQASQLKDFADANVNAWKERVGGWRKELEAHKEFGGEKLKEFDSGATEVVVKYGGQDLMKMLQESGYSNHPAVAQFLWNIHKAMRPDKIVTPHAQATGERDDVATRLFPSMKK